MVNRVLRHLASVRRATVLDGSFCGRARHVNLDYNNVITFLIGRYVIVISILEQHWKIFIFFV